MAPSVGIQLACTAVMISIVAGAAVPDSVRISGARVRFTPRGASASVRVEGRELHLNRVSGTELRAVVPIKSLRAGNRDLNARIRKTLDADRCPDAVFVFDPRKVKLEPESDAYRYKSVTGQLTLRCQSQRVTALYSVQRVQDKLRINGAIRVDLKQYGIDECFSDSCGTLQGNVGFAFTIDDPLRIEGRSRTTEPR